MLNRLAATQNATLRRVLRYLYRLATIPHRIVRIILDLERLSAQVESVRRDIRSLEGSIARQVNSAATSGSASAPGWVSDHDLALLVRQQQTFMSIRADAVVCNMDGMYLSLPAEDMGHVATWLYNPEYDQGQRILLSQLLRPGMTVVDVGANVGVMTVLASRLVGPEGKVIAYEPIPRLASFVRNNIVMNVPLHQIEVREACAFSSNGTIKFQYIPGNNRISTAFSYGSEVQEAEYIQVPSVRLDEDLDSLKQLDLVKIDAEGAECHVLRGMDGLLRRFPRVRIMCEFEPDHLRRGGSSANEFIKLCQDYGLRAALIDERTGTARRLANIEQLRELRGNLLLMRE